MSISAVDSLRNRIELGRKGVNKGIPSGFPAMDKYTYGIQKGYLTTVAADSSGGKSSYVLYSAVYMPIKYAIENNLDNINLLYFSLEMSSDVLMAKLLSIHLFEEYNEVVSYKDILSLEEKLPDNHYDLINKSVEWLEKVDQLLTIFDKSINAKQVDFVLSQWLSQFGSFSETTNSIKYTPDDPEGYNIVVIDHIKLLTATVSTKDEIDKCVDILIKYRNNANITAYIVQQANRGFKSMDRRNSANKYLELQDLADSSSPAQGSELVIALNYPHREKQATANGFDINIMKSRFRLIGILKNRFGESDKLFGSSFFGEIGMFGQMPSPKPNTYYDYKHYLDINNVNKSGETSVIRKEKVDLRGLNLNIVDNTNSDENQEILNLIKSENEIDETIDNENNLDNTNNIDKGDDLLSYFI